LFYEWNKPAEAASYLSEGIARAETGALLLPTRCSNSRVSEALQNDHAAATELSEQASELMDAPNIKTDALNQARIEHAMLMLNQHNIPAATKWAATFGPALNTDPDPWIEHEYLAMARVMIAQNESQRIIPALEALRKDATKSGRNGSQLSFAWFWHPPTRLAAMTVWRAIDRLKLCGWQNRTNTSIVY